MAIISLFSLYQTNLFARPLRKYFAYYTLYSITYIANSSGSGHDFRMCYWPQPQLKYEIFHNYIFFKICLFINKKNNYFPVAMEIMQTLERHIGLAISQFGIHLGLFHFCYFPNLQSYGTNCPLMAVLCTGKDFGLFSFLYGKI